MVIGQYRQRGILRRLGVTPVRPLTLLLADLTVWVASAVLSVALVVAVVRFAFHVPLPAAAGWFVLSVGLGIASLFALGMLAAAVSPTARGAAGIGWLLFFPNMFLAGVYFPTEEMSSTMRQVGNFTPLGSSGGGSDPAARRAGGASQRGQACRRVAGLDHAVLHGGRGEPRRTGRRCRIRTRRDPQGETGGGFGLIAMRQRVQRLAGQLEIESEPGAGTVVSASLPAIGLAPPPRVAMEAGSS
jgi:ABC-2 type transporter